MKTKHEPYIHRTGMAIDMYVTTWRCHNCPAETSLGVTMLTDSDEDCPRTGAPDWKALDRAEYEAGVKRFRQKKAEPFA